MKSSATCDARLAYFKPRVLLVPNLCNCRADHQYGSEADCHLRPKSGVATKLNLCIYFCTSATVELPTSTDLKTIATCERSKELLQSSICVSTFAPVQRYTVELTHQYEVKPTAACESRTLVLGRITNFAGICRRRVLHLPRDQKLQRGHEAKLMATLHRASSLTYLKASPLRACFDDTASKIDVHLRGHWADKFGLSLQPRVYKSASYDTEPSLFSPKARRSMITHTCPVPRSPGSPSSLHNRLSYSRHEKS